MAKRNSSKADIWRTPEKLEYLECLARDNYSFADIQKIIGVSSATFVSWRKKYPEIDKALQTGKEETDYRVENALLKSALGYKTTEVKISLGQPDKNGNRIIKEERTVKEIPPNPTACMGWLNNRKPEQWKRNRDNFASVEKDNNITVNIIKNGENKNETWDAEVDDE